MMEYMVPSTAWCLTMPQCILKYLELQTRKLLNFPVASGVPPVIPWIVSPRVFCYQRYGVVSLEVDRPKERVLNCVHGWESYAG